MEDYTKHEALARENFKKGYNCAQSIMLAYTDVTGLDEDTALRMASPFGGGMGRMREVCGAISGIYMVLGLLEGYSTPGDDIAKKELYSKVQSLAESYRQENGSIICRELLGLTTIGPDDPTPSKRTDEYYKLRPCEVKIGNAARILDLYLNM